MWYDERGRKVLCECPICGQDIFPITSTMEICGAAVHIDCWEKATSPDAVMEYVEAYPNEFFDFLKGILTDIPDTERKEKLRLLLEDFRNSFVGNNEFEFWYIHGGRFRHK